MKENVPQTPLRMIAVKPNEHCHKRYSKILSSHFYIFYDDYEEKGGKLVKKKGESLKKVQVPEDFYQASNEVSVSISAIIGKNGDGKSTIVELIMRILNNFAYAGGFTEDQASLKKINNLYAELYYELNGSLYCIISEGDQVVWKRDGETLATLATSHDKLKNNKVKINKIGLEDNFFYTQISNYSLYAYNSKELEGESNGGHWIDGVFHKNDGYQTPIVLNPMRTEGEIHINTENDLTKQRLISLLITDTSKDSFRWINDKQLAQAFQIRLFEKTKLELKTFLDFFENYSERDRRDYFPSEKGENRDIESYINDIGNVRKMLSEYDTKTDITDEVTHATSLLNSFYEITQLVDKNMFNNYLKQSEDLYDEIKKIHHTIAFYTYELERLIKKGKINSKTISKKKLVNQIEKVRIYFNSQPINLGKLSYSEYRLNGFLNFVYLQRIITVAMCEEIWKEKIKNLKITTYENITNKIMDYLIYKTISIISKYPNYKNLSKNIFTAIDFTSDNEKILLLKNNLKTVIDKIWKDIDETKSHITLKMRQCIHFLENDTYGKVEYTTQKRYVNISKFYHEIRKGENEKKESLYDYFFPPIFDSDIILKQIREEKKELNENQEKESLFANYYPDNDPDITLFSHLSSGERQQINVVSAVIYHLRNIDSVSDKDLVKYKHVNLIFEEIELYFHPEFQRIFLDFLLKHISKTTLSLKSINLCFVTHSPFILSDIPKQNILVLKKGETFRDKPFNLGANIHEMLGHNFMLEYTTGEIIRHKINEFLEEYSNFKEITKTGKDYVFPKGNNFYFLIKNMGDGYLKSLLDGYYEEMMQSSAETYNDLIKQKEKELKELKEERNKKVKKERAKK